jgi:hypothetical protein
MVLELAHISDRQYTCLSLALTSRLLRKHQKLMSMQNDNRARGLFCNAIYVSVYCALTVQMNCNIVRWCWHHSTIFCDCTERKEGYVSECIVTFMSARTCSNPHHILTAYWFSVLRIPPCESRYYGTFK